MVCVCEKAGVCMPQCVWEGPRTPQVSVLIFLLIYDNSHCIARLAGPQAPSTSPVPAVILPRSTGVTSSFFVLLSVDPGDMNSGPVIHMETLYQLSHCLSLKWTFICFEMFSLYSPGWPGTYNIEQTSLQLTEVHQLLLPEHWDLKVFTMMPGQASFLKWKMRFKNSPPIKIC